MALEVKRKVILNAEVKMAHFEQLLRERPRLAGLWRYWWNWYRVRRADWYTRLWLEEVRAMKKSLRSWEQQGLLEQHLRDTEVMAKNCDVIEDGLKIIEVELKETLELARERNWKVRYPRPQVTMEGWISSIHDRYPIIKEWIKRIREELPAAWISFCYVIYYAYTSPGAERHLEAHLESKCINNKDVKAKVKELANKILRAFVAAPRVVAGEIRPGYAQPLLRSAMAKPPYEGRIIENQNLWQWGVSWVSVINYMSADKRVIPSENEGEIKVFKEVPIRCEVFDYDFAQLRSYVEAEVPATWWLLTLEKLLEILGIEIER